jgi:mannitol-specific phosphotransferase system IIBC component
MPSIDASQVRTLIVACDAGMGSSVMLASTLKKQLKKTAVEVVHTPVHHVPPDAQLVLCHHGLADRARTVAPGAVVVSFQLFLGDPAVSKVVDALKNGGAIDG